MSRFFKYRTQQDPQIEMSEQGGIRSMHLGGTMVQSAMKLSAPNDLVLAYTQHMMGFLLFHPAPKHVLMIGLGGGSLAKFFYHHMPQTKTTVIEINSQIVTTARQYFSLPNDDERLQIVIADGHAFLARNDTKADVLLIDGFDNGCQVSSLSSLEFYQIAHNILNKNGIMVVNLLSRDKAVKDYVKRIENSFNRYVISIMSEVRGNLIVFAFKNSPGKIPWNVLKMRATALENKYSLPFTAYVAKLHKQHAHNRHALEL